MLDIRSLKTIITVGGYDLSQQLQAVLVSDDYLDERGLVTTVGTIDLTRTIGGRSLDDFFGIDWLRIGTIITVKIQINGITYPHPRGYLLIVGTKYNPKTGANQIDVVCPIGYAAGSDMLDELLIPPNIGTAHAAIDLLFFLANCGNPVWHTTKDYPLYDRPSLGKSYIESAGEMLAAMGCYAYSDGLGVIQIRAVAVGSGSPLFTLNEAALVTFESVLVGKNPAKNALCTGTYRVIRDRPLVFSNSFPVTGDIGAIVPGAAGTGIISRTTITETIDFVNSIVVSQEVNDRLGFQVYKGRSGYPRSTPVRESSRTITKIYSKTGQHELLLETELNTTIAATALQSFGEWADHNQKPFAASTDIPGKRIKQFSYSDTFQLLATVESIWVPIGETLASLSTVDWLIVYNAFGLPDEEFLSERNTQIWSKDTGDWQRVTIQEYTNLRVANGQAGINERITKAKPSDLLGIYRDAASCSAASVKHETSTSGQVTPPDIERLPSRIITESKHAEVTVTFTGFVNSVDISPKTKNYTCPYLPDVRPAGEAAIAPFLYEYAATWHKITLDRWRSCHIELPFTTALLGTYPYALIDCTRQGDLGTGSGILRLAMNAATWAIAPDRALVSADCTLQGVVAGGNVIPTYTGRNQIKLKIAHRFTVVNPSFIIAAKVFLKLALRLRVTV